jgi:prophage maintenance system killer protein
VTAHERYAVYDPMRERTRTLRRALLVLDDARPSGLSLEALICLHRLLLPPDDHARGRLRDGPGVVRLHGKVWKHLPPPSEACAMATIAMQWLNGSVGREGGGPDPVSKAAEIAFLLVQAHPFWDGNGRVSRAVAAWVLIQAGYELWFDMRIYCRHRTDAYFRAIAARNESDPAKSDPAPWLQFFSNMVAYCCGPPAPNNTTSSYLREHYSWRGTIP